MYMHILACFYDVTSFVEPFEEGVANSRVAFIVAVVGVLCPNKIHIVELYNLIPESTLNGA